MPMVKTWYSRQLSRDMTNRVGDCVLYESYRIQNGISALTETVVNKIHHVS